MGKIENTNMLQVPDLSLAKNLSINKLITSPNQATQGLKNYQTKDSLKKKVKKVDANESDDNKSG
jgi:hypothetical protein